MHHRLQTASIHTYVRTAGPLVIDWGCELLLPPGPWWRGGRVSRMPPGASLSGCAIPSGRPSGAWELEATESVGVTGLLCKFLHMGFEGRFSCVVG